MFHFNRYYRLTFADADRSEKVLIFWMTGDKLKEKNSIGQIHLAWNARTIWDNVCEFDSKHNRIEM